MGFFEWLEERRQKDNDPWVDDWSSKLSLKQMQKMIDDLLDKCSAR